MQKHTLLDRCAVADGAGHGRLNGKRLDECLPLLTKFRYPRTLGKIQRTAMKSYRIEERIFFSIELGPCGKVAILGDFRRISLPPVL